MGLSIAGLGALAGSSGAAASATINTALQAQLDASQTALVSALFGSLGLGMNTDALA